MKILYLCSDLSIPVLGGHGASVHIRSLIAALHRSGHHVILAAPLLNKSPWEQPASVSASVLHLRPAAETDAAAVAIKLFNRTVGVSGSLHAEIRRVLYNRDLLCYLKERFTDDLPDFVYERAALYSTAGVQFAREIKRPLVLELNAPLALEQTAYRGTCLGELAAQAERRTLSQATLVLTVSAPLRQHVLELGIEPDRVHVVPNGIDGSLFRPRSPEPNGDAKSSAEVMPAAPYPRPRSDQQSQSEPAGHNGDCVLGFIGGLKPWHGVDVLPRLVERLIPRHPRVRLIIAGDGPLKSDLLRNFQESGLSNRVTFTGAIPHERIPDWINSFDVALAPYTRPEHPFYFSPLKLFEYMACGVPLVAARLGQIEEVIRHGETGLLYPPGELDGLAAACDQLLCDPDLRRRLGHAAAEEVHRSYTWDHNAARVIELVRSLPMNQELVP